MDDEPIQNPYELALYYKAEVEKANYIIDKLQEELDSLAVEYNQLYEQLTKLKAAKEGRYW